MRTKGIFRIAAFLATAATHVKGFFAPTAGSNSGGGMYGYGRAAFQNVSAGRQHNVKTRHPL